MSGREGYIAGLRDLADRLERHPDAPLPHHMNELRAFVAVFDKDGLAAAARCYGGDKALGDDGLELRGGVPGLNLDVVVLGSRVCERVQVGTETRVEREEVRPAEYREVEREVPVYEWSCPDSILAPNGADSEVVSR